MKYAPLGEGKVPGLCGIRNEGLEGNLGGTFVGGPRNIQIFRVNIGHKKPKLPTMEYRSSNNSSSSYV